MVRSARRMRCVARCEAGDGSRQAAGVIGCAEGGYRAQLEPISPPPALSLRQQPGVPCTLRTAARSSPSPPRPMNRPVTPPSIAGVN